MTILIDDPRWPAHGRLWAHLVSDSDLDELHEFAAANGVPRRGFDLDHYDVPEEAHARLREANVYCSLREGSLRFSPHLFNTVDEMARVAEILQETQERR